MFFRQDLHQWRLKIILADIAVLVSGDNFKGSKKFGRVFFVRGNLIFFQTCSLSFCLPSFLLLQPLTQSHLSSFIPRLSDCNYSPGLFLFSFPCPYYVPICVTHEACLLVKNKRWKGSRPMQGGMQGVRRGVWWVEVRVWMEDEGELTL